MDLTTELKNLGAMDTMQSAGYEKGGSFRDQIRDMDKQSMLLTGDKDFADLDAQTAIIHQAEAEYKAEPNDPSKAMKLVDALEKTEHPDFESKAIDILQDWYDKTKQFRYRQRIGLIHMKQLARMERSKREALMQDPKNEDLRKEYSDFRREQIEFEFKEYELAADAYPTDMRWKFEMGKRHVQPVQFPRRDSRFAAGQERSQIPHRCRAFARRWHSSTPSYLDEADDTLGEPDQGLPASGDDRSKEMFYWRGRVLEEKGMTPGSAGPLQQGRAVGLQFQRRSSPHEAAQAAGQGQASPKSHPSSVLRHSPMILEASDVSFSYGDRPAIRDVSLSLDPGQIIALIGPNGSGKSTLIKALLGHVPASGRILWSGKDLKQWRLRDLAHIVAYLPQSPRHEPGQSVSDVLRLGRAARWGAFGLESSADQRVTLDVARLLGLDSLLDRPLEQMSGGQRQRVFIGRCLTQEPQRSAPRRTQHLPRPETSNRTLASAARFGRETRAWRSSSPPTN